MVVKMLVVYPAGLVADWELPLAAAAQQQEIASCISLAWEKIQLQNPKYVFYCLDTAFAPSRNQKIIG